MSLALYMDENVDGPVIDQLRRRGVEVLSVQEDGRSGTDDEDVLDRASELGRVVYTNDVDLLVIAKRRQEANKHFAGVIYARKTAVTIGQAVEDLEVIAKLGSLDDFANKVTYLPWR